MLEYAASLPWGWIIPVFFVLGYTVAAVALVHALLGGCYHIAAVCGVSCLFSVRDQPG